MLLGIFYLVLLIQSLTLSQEENSGLYDFIYFIYLLVEDTILKNPINDKKKMK